MNRRAIAAIAAGTAIGAGVVAAALTGYEIPPELVKGKEKVTVRFQAVDGQIGPVYGVRMVRADAPR
jgi:hypothetical protein